MRRAEILSLRRFAVILGVLAATFGCRPADPSTAAQSVFAQGWAMVFEGPEPDNRGSTLRVAVDTIGGRALADGTRLVWFETRHSIPRTEGGRPFDRELLRVALQCSETPAKPPRFKSVSSTSLYGEQPPVYQEAIAVADLERTAWRDIKPATADAVAFAKGCAITSPLRAHSIVGKGKRDYAALRVVDAPR